MHRHQRNVMPVEPLVLPSARRHQVADEDMQHAYRNTVWVWEQDDVFVMHTGPARDGQLLDVGVSTATEGIIVIVHAMKARPQYMRR